MTEKKDVAPKKVGKMRSLFATLFVLTAAAGSGGCQAPMSPSSW
jgi:hypothetical protein